MVYEGDGVQRLVELHFHAWSDFLMIAQIYNGYLDDTGTDSSKDIVAVGGWIGTYQGWLPFEQHWRAALPDEADGDFHYTDFWARKSFGADWDHQRRIVFMQTLSGIVSEHARLGIGVVLSKREYERVLPESYRRMLKSPAAFCLSQCLLHIIEKHKESRLPYPSKPFRFMFDGQKSQGAIADTYYFVRSLLEHDKLLGDLSFGPRKTEPTLQAADLLVGELRRQREGEESLAIDILRKKQNIIVSFLTEANLQHYADRVTQYIREGNG